MFLPIFLNTLPRILPLCLKCLQKLVKRGRATWKFLTNDGSPSGFGADTMFSFSPFTSSEDPPERQNQNNRGFLDLNRSTDLMNGENSIDVNNDKSEFNRESDNSYPEWDDNVTADYSMNFMLPWCEPATSYPIKSRGAEAKASRISSNTSPILGNFGITENNNDVTVFPRPHIFPQDANGDFLSLGIGSGAEIKSSSNFNSQEIASKLEDSKCKSSIVGQGPTNAWNLDSFMGLASGVQTNSGGLSRPALAGSSRSNLIHFPGFEAQQANPLYDNFVNDLTQPSLSSSPTGIPVTPQRGRVAQSPMGPPISRPTPHANQFIPRQQQYSRRSCMNASSESFTINLSDSLKGSSISHAQLGTLIPLTEATQSVAGGHFPGGGRYRGSVQPLTSTSTGVTNTNICPSPASFQPVVHSGSYCNLGPIAVSGNSLFPRSLGLPIPIGRTIQSAAAGLFPRRLGVQPNEPTVRTIGGTPAMRLPAQAYPVRPLLASGQHHHGMPAQLPMDFPRADYSSGTNIPAQAYSVRPLVSPGQFTPVAKYGVRPPGPFVSHPHLKRRATGNPSPALARQRRKISHRPVSIHHPATGQRPSFPAPIPAASHVRTAPHHIKWQGFDEPLEPSGHKCLLCKRDISFSAEGQVYQPAIPPAVAILACGHTFHEDCLQRITPEDYSIDPPCIPCALGEI